MAAKQGYGLPYTAPFARSERRSRLAEHPEIFPADWSSLQLQLRRRQAAGRFTSCQYSSGMRRRAGLAAIALAEGGSGDGARDKEKDNDKDKEKEKPRKPEEIKLPEEFLGQMIKEVVMHEVGHSLGLRHNFKASTMLDADQLHDVERSPVEGDGRERDGLQPDQPRPARAGSKGDYTTTTIGPYDYWAIEYAYRPDRWRRGGRAQEDRRSLPRAGARPMRPTRTCISTTTRR